MAERANFVGLRVGNYQLVQLLGKGGFAEVYLGMHIHLNTQVAVKLLHTRLAQEDVEDFRREAQMIAKLVHPNIVRVLDFGVEGDIPYLAMDYAPSGTLRQRHPKGSLVAPQVVAGYVRQVSEALQHAHDQRLIHRDVKPENMLLGRNNEVLLSDFGIALAAQSSQYQSTQNIAGTIGYMAPEQIQAHPRPASDQYSLGVVVYEWLSGNRPFQGSFTEIAVKHAMVLPPPLRMQIPQLAPAVEEVVMIALAKDPYKRFVHIRAFADALEQATQRGSFSLTPTQLSTTPSSFPPAPDGVRTYVQNTVSTARPNNSAEHSHATSAPYPITPSYPSAPGANFYPPAPSHNFAAAGGMATPGQAPNSGPAMPYGGIEMGQSPPLYRMNGAQQIYGVNGAGINGAPQKRRLSRRAIIAGMAGLVVTSSALTWAIVTHQTAATRTASGTNPIQIPGGTYTYPTPTAAVPPVLTYSGQQGYIWSVAWSPDGAYIVSGSDDGTAHVWRSDTGARIIAYRSRITPARDNDWAKKVAWAPDSKRIAVAFMDATAQGVDINTGRELFRYSNSTEPTEALAWSPNGRYVVVGDFGNTAVVYDVTSGKSITIYTDHSDSVLALAWSPDSKRIASGSSDGTARIWDALSGTTQLIYKNHKSDVESIAWSHDGLRIASAGLDGTAQVWQANGGYTLLTYTKHTGGIVNSVAWSPNDTYIASGGNDVNTHVWVATNGNIHQKFYTFPIFGLDWSPNGKHIVTAGYNKVSQVWKVL